MRAVQRRARNCGGIHLRGSGFKQTACRAGQRSSGGAYVVHQKHATSMQTFTGRKRLDELLPLLAAQRSLRYGRPNADEQVVPHGQIEYAPHHAGQFKALVEAALPQARSMERDGHDELRLGGKGVMFGADLGQQSAQHIKSGEAPAEFAAQERLPQVAFVNAVEKEGFPRRQRLEASRAGRERRVLQRSRFAAMRAVSDAAARQTETARGAKQRSRKALLISPDSSGSGASGSACPFCSSRRSRREERFSAQGTAALIQPQKGYKETPQTHGKA